MVESEVVEFVDRHGHNPHLRDSGHAVLLRTHRGLAYHGLGIHALRTPSGDLSSLLLVHGTGTMHFQPWEVAHVSWTLPTPEILAAAS